MDRQQICEILTSLEGYILDIPTPEVPAVKEIADGSPSSVVHSPAPLPPETKLGTGVENPIVAVINLTPCTEEEDLVLENKMLASINLFTHKNAFIMDSDILFSDNILPASVLKRLSPQSILFFGGNSDLKKLGHNKRQMKGELFDFYDIPSMITFSPKELNACLSLKKLAWQDLKIFRKHLLEISAEYREFGE